MKETYKSPEMELLCLAPSQRIATNQEVDFDTLTGGTGGTGTAGSSTQGDTEIDLPL